MVSCEKVVKGGLIATESGTFKADIGIDEGRITALAASLPDGRTTIDASGLIVTPGGVDSHCHIEQMTASGLMNADTFATATRTAALGGTTTVIPFAAQQHGASLKQIVEDYHKLADGNALVDYAFHMIITDPRPDVMKEELPSLVRAGHSSLKCFLTYDRLRVEDEQFLEVLLAARTHGCMVCVHAENHGMISWMGKRLVEASKTRAPYHVVSHPRLGEPEAINRAISMATLLDQPLMIFHVSTAEGAAEIRRWQGEGSKVFGETCTQYLTMTSADLDKPDPEGLKWVCSPPLRDASDQRALWQALANGTLTAISSDHAPYRMDASGKLALGPNPSFKQAANGMPGIGMRMPVLFDAMVSRNGGPGIEAFVRLTSSEPARIYGLHPKKGTIAIGADADLVLWDAGREVEVTDDIVADRAGYSPFVGRRLKGWPEKVMLRGDIVVEHGKVASSPARGAFLPRQGGPAAAPTGNPAREFDPAFPFNAGTL